MRITSSILAQMAAITEDSFGSDSRFQLVKFTYPVRPLPLFGFDWSFGTEAGMMITVFILTIVFALLLKGFFGVEF